MRVLVTGGAGFIGSAVCRQLARRPGFQILNLDALTYASSLSSLAEIADCANYRFIKGDVCDRRLLDAVFANSKPQTVIHLAAESHVDRSITGASSFVQTNIVGTHTLLDAALAYWDKLDNPDKQAFRFLHVSTDEVYGSLGEDGLFHETTPYDPRSPYLASKAASDHLVSAWWHTYGLPVVTSNCSNNYGPYQFPEKLIPTMILKTMRGESLPVYGDGMNVRDWLYVDDHAEALSLIMESGRPGETYNVGGRSERTNLEIVRTIQALVSELAPQKSRSSSEIEFVRDRPGHDHRYAVDCGKLENELGWRRRMTFDAGIRATVQWYLDRRDWWEPLFSGRRLGLRD